MAIRINEIFDEALQKYGQNSSDIFREIENNGLKNTIIRHANLFFNKPIENNKIAGIITMYDLYKNCPLDIVKYAETFKKYLRIDVYNYMIDNADKLQKIVHFERDFEYGYFAVSTFMDGYLSKLHYRQRPKEIPQFCFLRIAIGEFVSRGESDEHKFNHIHDTYTAYSLRQIGPASPTYYNMGFSEGASISCMIYTIADSLNDILSVQYEIGLAIKNNAGIGVDFSELRHSEIGRHGESQGIVPLAQIIDKEIKYINQGGRRPGAATVSLMDFHKDVPEFVAIFHNHAEDSMRVEKLNSALMLSDLFMERVMKNESWTLFCPKQAKGLTTTYGKEQRKLYIEYEKKSEVWNRYKLYETLVELIELSGLSSLSDEEKMLYEQYKKEFEKGVIPERIESRVFEARKLMEDIAEVQQTRGMPYIAYSDVINNRNPLAHHGKVRSLNLCMEVGNSIL